jgi:uncharacterized membrane protein
VVPPEIQRLAQLLSASIEESSSISATHGEVSDRIKANSSPLEGRAGAVMELTKLLMVSSTRGPLPPPEMLEHYAKIDPDLPRWLRSRADSERAHRHQLDQASSVRDDRAQDLEARDRRIGQVFAFTIGLGTILAGSVVTILAILYDRLVGAIGGPVISVGGVASLVYVFIQGRKLTSHASRNVSRETARLPRE